uniref:GGDEF domain-containing protein n=1 Tax=Steinernema glaseri TaxID=37863 RepID=A0A1I7YMF7_9BILA
MRIGNEMNHSFAFVVAGKGESESRIPSAFRSSSYLAVSSRAASKTALSKRDFSAIYPPKRMDDGQQPDSPSEEPREEFEDGFVDNLVSDDLEHSQNEVNIQREAQEQRRIERQRNVHMHMRYLPTEYPEDFWRVMSPQLERTNYDFIGSQRRLAILLASIDRLRRRMERMLLMLSRRYPEHRLRFSGEN